MKNKNDLINLSIQEFVNNLKSQELTYGIKGDYQIGLQKGFPQNYEMELDFDLIGEFSDQDVLEIIRKTSGEKKVTVINDEKKPYGGRMVLQIVNTIDHMQVPFITNVNYGGLNDDLIFWNDSKMEETGKFDEGEKDVKIRRAERMSAEIYYELIMNPDVLYDWKCFYDIFRIMDQNMMEGRRIKDSLLNIAKENKKVLTKEDINAFEIVKSNIGRNRRFNNFTKEYKLECPSLGEIIVYTERLFDEVWKSILSEVEFFGCWIPELKRYID